MLSGDESEIKKIRRIAENEHEMAMMWHGDNGELFYYNDKIMPYMIGSFKKDGMNTSGYLEVNVPNALWAVFLTDEAEFFSGKIAEYIRETCDRIFSEWFPASGYEHAQLPELEVYIENENGKSEHCEIWIPIKENCNERYFN